MMAIGHVVRVTVKYRSALSGDYRLRLWSVKSSVGTCSASCLEPTDPVVMVSLMYAAGNVSLIPFTPVVSPGKVQQLSVGFGLALDMIAGLVIFLSW